MEQQLFEVLLVIQDKSVNNRFVDLDRRKLILIVFIDHCSQFGEVLANFRGTVANYQVEFIKHLFKELVVAFNVF